MTAQPPARPPTAAELKRDCHRLIEVIATRPGHIKLLLGARVMLATFAAYKQRRDPFARGRKTDDGRLP